MGEVVGYGRAVNQVYRGYGSVVRKDHSLLGTLLPKGVKPSSYSNFMTSAVGQLLKDLFKGPLKGLMLDSSDTAFIKALKLCFIDIATLSFETKKIAEAINMKDPANIFVSLCNRLLGREVVMQTKILDQLLLANVGGGAQLVRRFSGFYIGMLANKHISEKLQEFNVDPDSASGLLLRSVLSAGVGTMPTYFIDAITRIHQEKSIRNQASYTGRITRIGEQIKARDFTAILRDSSYRAVAIEVVAGNLEVKKLYGDFIKNYPSLNLPKESESGLKLIMDNKGYKESFAEFAKKSESFSKLRVGKDLLKKLYTGSLAKYIAMTFLYAGINVTMAGKKKAKEEGWLEAAEYALNSFFIASGASSIITYSSNKAFIGSLLNSIEKINKSAGILSRNVADLSKLRETISVLKTEISSLPLKAGVRARYSTVISALETSLVQGGKAEAVSKALFDIGKINSEVISKYSLKNTGAMLSSVSSVMQGIGVDSTVFFAGIARITPYAIGTFAAYEVGSYVYEKYLELSGISAERKQAVQGILEGFKLGNIPSSALSGEMQEKANLSKVESDKIAYQAMFEDRERLKLENDGEFPEEIRADAIACDLVNSFLNGSINKASLEEKLMLLGFENKVADIVKGAEIHILLSQVTKDVEDGRETIESAKEKLTSFHIREELIESIILGKSSEIMAQQRLGDGVEEFPELTSYSEDFCDHLGEVEVPNLGGSEILASSVRSLFTRAAVSVRGFLEKDRSDRVLPVFDGLGEYEEGGVGVAKVREGASGEKRVMVDDGLGELVEADDFYPRFVQEKVQSKKVYPQSDILLSMAALGGDTRRREGDALRPIIVFNPATEEFESVEKDRSEDLEEVSARGVLTGPFMVSAANTVGYKEAMDVILRGSVLQAAMFEERGVFGGVALASRNHSFSYKLAGGEYSAGLRAVSEVCGAGLYGALRQRLETDFSGVIAPSSTVSSDQVQVDRVTALCDQAAGLGGCG